MPKPLSRVSVGLIVAAIFVGAAVAGGWAWSAIALVSIFIGQKELRTIFKGLNVNPSQIIIYTAAILMVLVTTLEQSQFLPAILTLVLSASFFRLLFRSPRATVADIGGTLIAVFYIIYLPVHYIMLRQINLPFSTGTNGTLLGFIEPGLQAVLMILVVISASDIAAYYVGKHFGRHPLYPEISPKKTREGAIAGLLGGVIMGLVLAKLLGFPTGHAAVLSVLLVITGQLGDLTESFMKRESGVKDSGELLASHGGFLDRLDSYIFCGAVCYYYIYWVMLKQGLAPEVIHWLHQLPLG